MTSIDEKLNKSLYKSDDNIEVPVREVFENNKLVRIYYNGGTLELDIERQELDLYGSLKLKSIKLLVDKFKELEWI